MITQKWQQSLWCHFGILIWRYHHLLKNIFQPYGCSLVTAGSSVQSQVSLRYPLCSSTANKKPDVWPTLVKSFHSCCHTTLYILICTRNIKCIFSVFIKHYTLDLPLLPYKKLSPPWDYDMFSRESLSSPGSQQMDALADGQLRGRGLAKVRCCSEASWDSVMTKESYEKWQNHQPKLGSKFLGGYQIRGLTP